jgi:hypothetical protein
MSPSEALREIEDSFWHQPYVTSLERARTRVS